MNRHTYNPPGVTKFPISIRLMPEELREVDGLAEAHNVTRSKILREATLKGLPLVKEALSAAGEATASPTSITA